jgi:hypothetical protein
LLQGDQAAFLSLPATPFAACKQLSTTASSLSLVRFDTNDYSVPVRWAHHPVVAKGDWQEVRLYAQGQEVAQHGRIWEKEQVRFEPLHYLALLERKPGALDHARPLAGWTLPECFGILRRRLKPAEGRATVNILVLRLWRSIPCLIYEPRWKGFGGGCSYMGCDCAFLFPREDWRFTVFRWTSSSFADGAHRPAEYPIVS